jgi:hypothetical protein
MRGDDGKNHESDQGMLKREFHDIASLDSMLAHKSRKVETFYPEIVAIQAFSHRLESQITAMQNIVDSRISQQITKSRQFSRNSHGAFAGVFCIPHFRGSFLYTAMGRLWS